MTEYSKEKKNNSFPPSTELIPDEYEVILDGRQCVHVFCPNDYIKYCEQLLKSLNIELKISCKHKLDSYGEVIKKLDNVKKTAHEDKTLLLLIFWGYSEKDGQFFLDNGDSLPFYKIWSNFCTGPWRNTPKIFLLNVIRHNSKTKRDSNIYKEFETPNEGDVLIVAKQSNERAESIEYFKNFKKAIEKHGKKEDFSSIVTAVEVENAEGPRPVLISTMLKKLYLIPSEYRGHQFSFNSSNHSVYEEISNINFLMQKIQSPRSQQRLPRDDVAKISVGGNDQAESGETRRSSHRSLPDNAGPRKSIETRNRSTSSNPRKQSIKKDPWHYC